VASENESSPRALSEHTTLGVGGPAARVVTVRNRAELLDALAGLAARDASSLLVLGEGSNVVVSDAGFPGTVVRVATEGLALDDPAAAQDPTCGGVLVTVAAGEDWDGFVAETVARGWAGVEALSGIPGSVGATPIQNVGAYGQEVSQTIARVAGRVGRPHRGDDVVLGARGGERGGGAAQPQRGVVAQLLRGHRLRHVRRPSASRAPSGRRR
jgi:UDP-N-acetylenolpyruvoylglucosamine reductase